MKKSKSIPTPDRLSELPNLLILSIFGLLPMKDVVATTVLSKRWRNLWTTTPYLNFAEFGSADADFITWTLMFWKGTRILKLKIDSSYTFQPYSHSHIDFWLRFAKDHDVQELSLMPNDFIDEFHYLEPPYLLSSCPSLQVLSLIACNLQIQTNVKWPQLKILEVYSEDGLTHDAVNRILLGSPQLEVLVMKFMDAKENLTIRSSSLKKLTIEKRTRAHEPLPNTRLTIWAPNLETLEIKYAPYSFYSLENVSSLTRITLRFDDVREEYFLHQRLNHVLQRIQHVRNVSLSESCIKVLLSLRNKHLDAKFLRLTSYFSDLKQTLGVLEMFPKLEALVLEDVDTFERYSEAINNFNFEPSLPNLTRVGVEWGDIANDRRIFILIEILLKHARSLETLEFRVKGNSWHPTPPEYLESALERMRRMQRASPTAKLAVCEFNPYIIF